MRKLVTVLVFGYPQANGRQYQWRKKNLFQAKKKTKTFAIEKIASYQCKHNNKRGIFKTFSCNQSAMMEDKDPILVIRFAVIQEKKRFWYCHISGAPLEWFVNIFSKI